MRKLLSVMLVGLLSGVAAGRAPAQSPNQNEAQAVEKVKAKIAKLGVGEKARAQIKLRGGQKLKGYVNSAGQNDFTFTDMKSGATTTVPYADVVEVNKPGLSRGKKIAIFAAVGVGALAIFAAVVVHSLNHLEIHGIRVP